MSYDMEQYTGRQVDVQVVVKVKPGLEEEDYEIEERVVMTMGYSFSDVERYVRDYMVPNGDDFEILKY